jgi:hypothetical protein
LADLLGGVVSFSNILVLHSVSDEYTSIRIDQINQSPKLKPYKFFHRSILNEREFRTMDLRGREMEKHILSVWGPRFMDKVRAISPDLLIVHGGVMLSSNPGPICEVLASLERKVPNMDIAIEEPQDPDYVQWKLGKYSPSLLEWATEHTGANEDADLLIREMF